MALRPGRLAGDSPAFTSMGSTINSSGGGGGGYDVNAATIYRIPSLVTSWANELFTIYLQL